MSDASSFQGWARALREIVLIVSSILIAFALNTWWDARAEDNRAEAYLEQLLADAESYERHLGTSIRHDQRMRQCAEAMLHYIHTEEADVPRDSLSTWLLGATNFSDVRPIEGTFESLIQTGDISLIESDSLRSRIVATTGYMDHTLRKLNTTEAELLAMLRDLQYEVDLHDLTAYLDELPIDPPTYRRFPVQFEDLRERKHLNGAMLTGYTFASIRLIYLQRLLDEVQGIERLLETELARR